MKSERNKTIDLSIEEGQDYLKKCIELDGNTDEKTILDKTIIGDTFEVMKLLPNNFVDLLIADPPYNLNKDFHGKKFKKTTDDLYEEYTDEWVKLVLPILKENSTIYVCCDWQSSPAIGKVL